MDSRKTGAVMHASASNNNNNSNNNSKRNNNSNNNNNSSSSSDSINSSISSSHIINGNNSSHISSSHSSNSSIVGTSGNTNNNASIIGATGYMSSSATPAALAPRKNVRQPDITLDLERKVSRRRKTKDDFELDNAPSSSSTSTATSLNTAGSPTIPMQMSSVNNSGAATSASSGMAALVSSSDTNSFVGHTQDDMSTTFNLSCNNSSSNSNGNNSSNSNLGTIANNSSHGVAGSISHTTTTTTTSNGHGSNERNNTSASSTPRSATRSNTFVDRSPAIELSVRRSSKQLTLETCTSISDGTSESTGASFIRGRGRNSIVAPPSINTQFLNQPIPSASASLSSTSTSTSTLTPLMISTEQGNTNNSANPSANSLPNVSTPLNPPTPAISLTPSAVEAAEHGDAQTPPYRHPLCPSPTYFALDFGGHGTPMSGFFQSGCATPRTPLAGGMLASPSVARSGQGIPHHQGNGMQNRSPFGYSPANSPSLSPAYATFLPSQDLLTRAISTAAAAREISMREAGVHSNGSSPMLNSLREKGKTALSIVDPIAMPASAVPLMDTTDIVRAKQLHWKTTVHKKSKSLTDSHLMHVYTPELEVETTSHDTRDTITSLAPINRCPAEVILLILSYLPSKSLHQCVFVSRHWHRLAAYQLYKSPPITSLAAFERLVNTISNDESSRINEQNDATSTSSIVPVKLNKRTSEPNTYAHLVQQLDLASMDEQHRCSQNLSRQLTRAAPFLHMSLRELDLGFCKGARNYDLQRIAPLLSNLTYLNLAGGGRTDIVISKIAKHCPRLQRLSVAWNASISDFGCAEIARSCPQLRSLDLTCCGGITDAGIASVIEGCSNLRILGVAYCNGVSNVSVYDVISHLPRLRWFSVAGCSGVTRACLRDCDIVRPGLVITRPGVLPLENDV